MNKIVTRGFGNSSNQQGMITQGLGGTFLEQVIDYGRNVVIGGKAAVRRIKKSIDEIIVRVTLVSIDDQYLGLTGAERSTPDQDLSRPRIATSYLRQRIVERIRLDVKRIK